MDTTMIIDKLNTIRESYKAFTEELKTLLGIVLPSEHCESTVATCRPEEDLIDIHFVIDGEDGYVTVPRNMSEESVKAMILDDILDEPMEVFDHERENQQHN